MKKRKATPVVRKSSKLKLTKLVLKKASKKKLLLRKRPIHKRVMLHPATIFMLLCAGVFLIGWTYRSFADNITVTASIFAPVPGSPATITYPADQTHFTYTPITITGTCPTSSYVKLYRNGVFSGSANCISTTNYQIQTDLNLGSNQFIVHVYNITDNEGPQSTTTTVWYDLPVQPLQSTPKLRTSSPPEILVANSADNVLVSFGYIQYASVYPTVAGTAPPYSLVTVTFHSNPLSCSTYADSSGNWSCSIDTGIPEGVHDVDVYAKTPSGSTLNFPTFKLYISSSITPLHVPTKPATPFTVGYSYQYKVYKSGQNYSWELSLSGGTAPYAITIVWGDGKTSTLVKSSADTLAIDHTYDLGSLTSKNYDIKITAVDNNHATANLQISALVTFNGSQPASKSASLGNTNIINNIRKFMKTWIWLVWPAYAVVLLMTTSFWLGEREETEKLIKYRQRRAAKKRKR